MAAIESPAPAERIAVLEISELPGSESMIDCAFFLGSSVGTLDANRAEARLVVRAGRFRAGIAGRRREAPVKMSATVNGFTCSNTHVITTYQWHSLPVGKPF